MNGDGFRILLFLAVAAVVVIVAIWLVRFVTGLKRTSRAYKEILEAKAGKEQEPKSEKLHKAEEEKGTETP